MNYLFFLNLFASLFVAVILAMVQTSLWVSVVGSLEMPWLWLPVIVYLCLYRKLFEGLLASYLCAIGLASFTIAPVGGLCLGFLFIGLVMSFVRDRMFWSGAHYFALMVALAFALFWISQIVLKALFGVGQMFDLSVLFSFFQQLALTPLLSYPIYHLLVNVDLLTEKEPVIEFGQRG